MTRTLKILGAIFLTFIAMQFVRPAKNSSNEIQQADMLTNFNVPDDVAGILKKSCYDCHSNNTRYPWYINIQPAGWLMARHVSDGKRELNFSAFTSYSQRRQLSKLKSIQHSIKDGSMPLSSYTLMHTDSKLSAKNKLLIIDWASKTIDSLSTAKE